MKDVYEYLMTLPSILPSGFDLYISYILHTFTSSHAFALIPAAHLGPYDPSILPQTHIGSVGALDGQVDTEGEKQQSGDETEYGAKTGVTEGAIRMKASRSALALEDWVNRMGDGNIKSGEENGRGKRSARNGPPSNSAVDVEKEGSEEQSVEASESKAKAEEEYFRSKGDLLKLAMLSPPHATIQDEEDDHQMEVDSVLPSTTNRTPKSLREALSEAESLAVQDIRELDALVRSRGWNIPLGASLLERAESQLGTGDGLEGRDVEIGGLLKMVHRSEGNTGAPENKAGTSTSRRKKN
ncbi:uncharacterized protein EI90DRAFT_3118678 [Cantharellus anzutake]|uniref:uncharacterized protein n=1 Tax=Cantharellus anzutake TaxID=1750568 RepID=UPI001904C92F|nr:uncharacterized protein EI90DRAFT_3118678 [Cantharellus anzutake]KAF8338269.1 hypothetical protein EI90DRAFT_3118678 [Cantharellus anzutake]